MGFSDSKGQMLVEQLTGNVLNMIGRAVDVVFTQKELLTTAE